MCQNNPIRAPPPFTFGILIMACLLESGWSQGWLCLGPPQLVFFFFLVKNLAEKGSIKKWETQGWHLPKDRLTHTYVGEVSWYTDGVLMGGTSNAHHQHSLFSGHKDTVTMTQFLRCPPQVCSIIAFLSCFSLRRIMSMWIFPMTN